MDNLNEDMEEDLYEWPLMNRAIEMTLTNNCFKSKSKVCNIFPENGFNDKKRAYDMLL